MAELTRQSDRQNLSLEQLLPRELWRVSAALSKVLDLTNNDTLESLGLAESDLVQDDLQLTRMIGEAAYGHRFQALLTTSATGVDKVLAIFPENLAGTHLETSLEETWTDERHITGEERVTD